MNSVDHGDIQQYKQVLGQNRCCASKALAGICRVPSGRTAPCERVLYICALSHLLVFVHQLQIEDLDLFMRLKAIVLVLGIVSCR